VLGPMLFNIPSNVLCDVTTFTAVCSFADEIRFFCDINFPPNCPLLQTENESVIAFEYVHCRTRINQMDTLKYTGIILDSKISLLTIMWTKYFCKV
jgi:hypothetical protein